MSRPARSQLIGTMVADAVLQTRMTWNAYADRVATHYQASVPLDERTYRFHVGTTADDAQDAARLNTQTVRRILSGESTMSVDIEESLLAALPAEWCQRVQTALLARDGLMWARLPAAAGDVAGQFVGPCDLMRRTADVVEHIAPALANGGIGPDDGLPLLVEARKDVRLLHGACATLDAQIAAALCQLAAEADRRVQ